jgi:hypothetical protein
LGACDDWQIPLFLTLALTGLRPGELCHLLLPDDLDLGAGVVRVRNKPALGWQVKTRNERAIPLVPALARVLESSLEGRRTGLLFRRRRSAEQAGSINEPSTAALERELARRVTEWESTHGGPADRVGRQRLARGLWRDLGAVDEGRVRAEFMRLTEAIGLPDRTAPKVLRHQFATALQEGRVDPLIRNELMGHVAAGARTAGHGLAMTAVYTHTRPEVCRQQLFEALAGRPAVSAAEDWLRRRNRQ